MNRQFCARRGRFWRALLCAALALMQLAACAPALADADDDALAKQELQARMELSTTRVLGVPSVGPVYYYAQTNPFWEAMEYEAITSPTHRNFGDAGCCPTSAAIAIGKHLTDEQLALIRPYAKQEQGFGISRTNMNPKASRSGDGIYWFTEPSEYRAFLPLVFGSFAAGNNTFGELWRLKPREWKGSAGGTSHRFVPVLCELYGLEAIQITGRYNMDWLAYVRRGATAVALSNTQWSPFVKANGHYVAIVGADDQYLYVMDPQDKTEYERDQKLYNVLEFVAPGLLRIKLENYPLLMFGLVWIIRPPTEEKVPDTMNAADWADGRFVQ